MSWSLGEARALGVKAARGAGLPWGLAEEVGFALDWLQSAGAPGIEALAALLDAREDKPFDPATSPFHLGTALADGARTVPIGTFAMEQPLLLIPFLAMAKYDQPVKLQWDDVSVALSESGIERDDLSQKLFKEKAVCSLQDISASVMPVSEIRVPDTAREAMQRLAHHAQKTYAPATEQSRLSGAGAGTSDND